MVRENTDIRSLENIVDIVDCVMAGTYGEGPERIIGFFAALPTDQASDYFRTLCIPYLFHATERIFKSADDPLESFGRALDVLREAIESAAGSKFGNTILAGVFEDHKPESFSNEVKNHTGTHYGNLFREFDHKSYFGEARDLLKIRLERNSAMLPGLENLSLLDQGCGGGRYTTAWKLLGVGKATGIDFSDIGLEDARMRVESAGIENIDFVKGSVLEMPFDDGSFDIVYSNGVLHHTEDWRKGIAEQLRVMKSGGWGWQYLIEDPGGIFWDSIEILRAIMKDVNKKFAQNIMRSLGIPMNRVFYMLDHVMVPINTRLSAEEIELELAKHGAVDIRRLNRGADFDRVEAIYKRIPFAREKFGIGENRFVFSKK